MAKVLKKSWFFRNKTNSLMSFLGVTSTAYFVQRYYTDKKFEHPIINQSLRLLGKNKQVIDLIGYPVVLESSWKSKGILNDESCYFSFIAKGPKGFLTVECNGQSISLQKLGTQALEDRVKYYISGPELMVFLEDNKLKNQGELQNLKTVDLPQNSSFWKIDYLYADLGDQYRIPIYPFKETQQKEKEKPIIENKTSQQTSEETQQNAKNSTDQNQKLEKEPAVPVQAPAPQIPTYLSERKTAYDLYLIEKQRVGEQYTGPKSEQEHEEIRKFRLNQLYQQVGYVRYYMMFIAVFGAMSVYIYIMKNKRKSIVGSQLHSQVINYITFNPKIKKTLGNNIRFSQVVRGSQISDKAEFEADFYAEKGFGTAQVKGTLEEKTNQWKIDDLTVEMKTKQEQIENIEKYKII